MISIGMLIFGMLLTGSINTISKKLQFEVTTTNVHGLPDTYEKPWSQTSTMFFGEFMCLLAYLYIKRNRSHHRLIDKELGDIKTEESPIAKDKPVKLPETRFRFIGLLLTLCDLTSTSLSGIGLLYTTASISQVIRGSVIIFTAAASVIFLKRRLKASQWAGVMFAVVGLVCVGFSSVYGSADEGKGAFQTFIGIVFILTAQLFSALQFILEEKTLKGADIEPLKLVGMEGLLGMLIMFGVVLPVLTMVPGSDDGSYENMFDTITQLGSSTLLVLLVLLYWCSIAFFNFFSLTMSKRMSATHRTLIDASRSATVWIVMLALYPLTGGAFGETLNSWSWLQLLGFLVLLAGTIIHNDVSGYGTWFVQLFGFNNGTNMESAVNILDDVSEGYDDDLQ
eukprot:gnl/Dysnectes_brevis/1438_a1629_1677.p1 GENE.gnl/Dysnectes_brevis/1438_a1629_1677~~gnl/Dysnectes_brevis/1438_a1629_1677.p1  ORF type:complete len:395 (-),score=105.75 gnl/Dysnectes_brevis/1438_a1629_1677:163-1347(-)